MTVPESSGSDRPYDIFISYSRLDGTKAALMRDLLVERGHHVFFDAEGIDIGAEFPEVIDQAVKGAKVVLGCWTPEAIRRRWVRIESRIGLDRSTLVAVTLEALNPEELPAEFYNVNVLDLSGFDGDPSDPDWQRVLAAIDRRLSRTDAPAQASQTAPRAAAKKPTARRSRLNWKLPSAALLAIALLGGAGWAIWGGSGFDRDAVTGHLEATVREAEPTMMSAVERALGDAEGTTNSKIFWAEAQLVAVSGNLSPGDRARYEASVAKFLSSDCHCVIIEGAPSSIVQLWALESYASGQRMPPADIVETMLGAQNRAGWWSSVLDAADRPDNAATYITAFAVIVLRNLSPVLKSEPALKARVDAARARAVQWLMRRRPSKGANWSDYPDNSLRSDSPSFSAVATLALLPEASVPEQRELAEIYIAGLDAIASVTDNFSNDINVTRASGETYVDNYRHVPTGWQIDALALAFPLAEGETRARAEKLLSSVTAISLSDPQLARQDWMLAEQFRGIRSARDTLKQD